MYDRLVSRAVAVVGAVGLVALVAAGGAQARPGYSLTQREGKGRTLQIYVSSAGASVTEYAVQGGRRRAVNGVILRYGDRMLFLLRPAERKYTRIGLVSALAHDAREREMARSSQPAVAREIAAESRSAPGVGVRPPPKIRGLTRTKVTGRSGGRVAGLRALRLDLTQDGTRERVYYAVGLPGPPAAIRGALARYARSAKAGTVDRVLGGHLDEVLLRRQIRVRGRWRRVFETTRAVRRNIADSVFAPPAGFSDGPLPAAASTSLSPSLGADGGLSAAAPSPLARTSNVPAKVQHLTGPVSSFPRIYAVYWGKNFSSDNRFQNYMDGFFRYVLSDYRYAPFWEPLGQYGIFTGAWSGSTVIRYDPPGLVGDWDVIDIEGMLQNGWTANGIPGLWWRTGPDPVIAIFVRDTDVNSSGWDGYHLSVPTLGPLLPFPLNLAVHPAVPWFIIRVPTDAAGSPKGPSTTGRTTHELVEAITDPFPFTANYDTGKNPAWSEAEIADICQRGTTAPWGSQARVGPFGDIVQTYWSQRDAACVPETRPSLTITAPTEGARIPYNQFSYRANAFSPIDGEPTVRWNDVPQGTLPPGVFGRLSFMSLGTHKLTASLTDSNGLSRTQTVGYEIVGDPPAVAITTPPNGIAVATDQTVSFQANVTDPQEGTLSIPQIKWRVDGVERGQGDGLVQRFTTPGDRTVSVTATNTANLSSSASILVHVIQATSQSPTISITDPPDNSIFPDGDTNPVTFKASASDPEDGPLAGASIKWYDSHGSVLNQPIGTGTQISTTLSRDQADANHNQYTQHTITAIATDSGGQTAIATITVRVGIVIT
jgi:hypothetical protein